MEGRNVKYASERATVLTQPSASPQTRLASLHEGRISQQNKIGPEV